MTLPSSAPQNSTIYHLSKYVKLYLDDRVLCFLSNKSVKLNKYNPTAQYPIIDQGVWSSEMTKTINTCHP